MPIKVPFTPAKPGAFSNSYYVQSDGKIYTEEEFEAEVEARVEQELSQEFTLTDKEKRVYRCIYCEAQAN